MTLVRALRRLVSIAAASSLVAALGAGCGAPPSDDDDDLGTAASAFTAQAHAHRFVIGSSHELQPYETFLTKGQTPAGTPRFCHVYTYWDIAEHDVSTGGPTHHRPNLFAWMKQAEGTCDETLVTFQGPQHEKGSVAPPSADAFEQAFVAFQKWTDPGQPLEKWAGKLSYTAWNEPNNCAGAGDGLGEEIPPERAAQYYLRLRKHCRPEDGCRVAAGDFATNGHMDEDLWRNCADDADVHDTQTICTRSSGLPVPPKNKGGPECSSVRGGDGPTYLDRYKHFIARHAHDETDGAVSRDFRPEFWGYHPWHDVNNYIDSHHVACSDYEHCVTKRFLESLSGSWRKSNIWDTEIGLGLQDQIPPDEHTTQPCGAAFLVRLTELSPRITRLYYMHFAGGHGPLLDGGSLRDAGNVLAGHHTSFTPKGKKCWDTGLELDRYQNPILPMFERPAGVTAPHDAPPTEGCPDPMGLRTSSGEYYIYCTSYTFKSSRHDGFPIFRSDTLAGHHWKRVGSLIPDVGPSRSSWPDWIRDENHHRSGEFWAPDVHELPNGKFVALYAAPCGSTQCVGMAWSDSPAGPWTHKMDAPFIDHHNNELHPQAKPTNTYDGNLLVTSNHELYLYWVVAGSGVWGRPVTAEKSGELRFKRDDKGHVLPPEHLQDHGEGPYMVEHDGTYYLFYSTNPTGGLVYDYQVRVRRAKSPLARFTPACTMNSQCDVGTCNNGVCDGSVTVLHKNDDADGGPVSGRAFVATGGNSVIHSAVDGVDFFVYHAILVPEEHACPRKDPTNGDDVPRDPVKNPYCRVQGERQAMIDPLTWEPDGKGGLWPAVNHGEPSTAGVDLPANETPPQVDWRRPAQVCTAGAAVDKADPCVRSVCEALPECCTSGWSQDCVGWVASYCVESYLCPGQCKTPAQCTGTEGCLADHTCGACVADYDCFPRKCDTTSGQCQ